jgi:hypothetical protein
MKKQRRGGDAEKERREEISCKDAPDNLSQSLYDVKETQLRKDVGYDV